MIKDIHSNIETEIFPDIVESEICKKNKKNQKITDF